MNQISSLEGTGSALWNLAINRGSVCCRFLWSFADTAGSRRRTQHLTIRRNHPQQTAAGFTVAKWMYRGLDSVAGFNRRTCPSLLYQDIGAGAFDDPYRFPAFLSGYGEAQGGMGITPTPFLDHTFDGNFLIGIIWRPGMMSVSGIKYREYYYYRRHYRQPEISHYLSPDIA